MALQPASDVLPGLPFGSRIAHLDNNVQDMSQRLRFILPGLQECESLVPEDEFAHRSSMLTLNGMRLAACAGTAIRARSQETTEHTLIIPYVGQATIFARGSSLRAEAGTSAVYLAACDHSEEATVRSFMLINIDPLRLEAVAHAMLGLEEQSAALLDLDNCREIKLQVGRVSFEIVMRQLTTVLDQFLFEPDLLEFSGLDDCFYRQIAVMMQPKLFLEQFDVKPDRGFARRKLDHVCQHILSRLNQPLSLTSLEQVGRMSKRSLHYAFQDRFGVTPMQWVRQERLTLARSQLAIATRGTSITALALACGFTKPARFASYYQQQFGELPSVTLARAVNR
ncbi:MAG: AraC family transcriptional regulator [Alcaligenaceae bacterium]|nr:AraC family transcriptional regulator [Alcaligenaceae bacterium]